MRRVYLDHNATTPTHPGVTESMMSYYGDIYGNASSIHWFGQKVRKGIDEAREGVAGQSLMR